MNTIRNIGSCNSQYVDGIRSIWGENPAKNGFLIFWSSFLISRIKMLEKNLKNEKLFFISKVSNRRSDRKSMARLDVKLNSSNKQTRRRIFSWKFTFTFSAMRPAVQSELQQLLETLWTYFAQNSNISSRFQKWGATASQVCRTAIIRPVLESFDPDASNGGSNVGVWLFGADVITFEKSELTK